MVDSIDYYNKYAVKFFEDTVDLDMTPIIGEFLNEMDEGATILDMGCGSGRDSLYMYELGYDVTAMDASLEMCRLAEVHTGLEVLQMKYEDMEFDDVFDGIWACGAFVHIPKDEMPAILKKTAAALQEQGILYLSVRLGNFEGFRGERYFSDYTETEIRDLLEDTGKFTIEKLWITADVRSNHPDTRWINVLARKK
ncbi:MAG: class I SAM-dependent methyltransferase [Lachnospiraceae bacterium]|jgi:cyclopropane fatty-acyl-phospholipid synthase-like methyltransferase